MMTTPTKFANGAKARRYLLCGVGVALLSAAAIGIASAAQKKREAIASLPKVVQDALDRAGEVYQQPLAGAEWTKVHKTNLNDHPVFQMQGTNGRGNKIEIEVTAAGRIIEVEEHGIPQSEVPGVVMDALRAKFPKFEPKKLEAVYSANRSRPLSYGFEGPDGASGHEIEVYVSADGKTFLNQK